MHDKPVASTTEAARIVASNRRYTRDTPPISADDAAREVNTLFPEKLGKAPLATIPEPPAFTRAAARRPIERPREPLLQWATGLTTTAGSGSRRSAGC